jgi:hypothetical protein
VLANQRRPGLPHRPADLRRLTHTQSPDPTPANRNFRTKR